MDLDADDDFQPDVEWTESKVLVVDAATGQVRNLLQNSFLQGFLCFILCLNFAIIIMETDRVSMKEKPSEVLNWIGRFCLLCFMFELIANLFVQTPRVFFDDRWNVMDAVIVITDVVSEISSLIFGKLPDVSWVRMLRLLRLAKLIRTVKLLRELSFMVRGLAGAMRAIAWAGVLLLMIMTLWAIIAVQVLHPLAEEVAESGMYADCERCARAYQTVFDANLTFFQHLVAGDSWGLVSIPIIEMFPMTGLLFAAILLSVNMGVMNLVLTVIVDQAVQCREQDKESQLQEKKEEFKNKSRDLVRSFEDMDKDGSGTLSVEEVLEGFEANYDFAQTLHLMGVLKADLKLLFTIMDTDNSGVVAYREFVKGLYQMQNTNPRTNMSVIKHQVVQLHHDLMTVVHDVRDSFQKQTEMLDKIYQSNDLQDPKSWLCSSRRTSAAGQGDQPTYCSMDSVEHHELVSKLDCFGVSLDSLFTSLAQEIRKETEKLAHLAQTVVMPQHVAAKQAPSVHAGTEAGNSFGATMPSERQRSPEAQDMQMKVPISGKQESCSGGGGHVDQVFSV